MTRIANFITDFFANFAQNLKYPCILSTNDPTNPSIVYINQHFEETTGYYLSEIIGEPYLNIVDHVSAPNFKEALQTCYSKGDLWKGELALKDQKGETLTVETSIFIINIAQENYLGSLFEIEAAENNKSDYLFQESIEKTHSHLIHDIKNNLQMVHGFSEILKHNLSGQKDCLDELDKVLFQTKQASENIERLAAINNYLDNADDDIEVKDLKAMILENLQMMYLPKKVKIETDLQDKIQIKLSKKALFSVLQNLLLNSYQADADTIHISCYAEDKKARINIKDNGNGIPPDNLKKIFKKSFTTKSYGTGFGLYSIKNIIESIGGKISVKSKVNDGTIFTLLLERNLDS